MTTTGRDDFDEYPCLAEARTRSPGASPRDPVVMGLDTRYDIEGSGGSHRSSYLDHPGNCSGVAVPDS